MCDVLWDLSNRWAWFTHTVTLLSLIKTKHAHLEVATENPPYYRPGWWDHASLAPSTTTLVFSRKWGQYVWESKDRGNDEGNILELCSTAIFHYYLLLYIVHIYYSKPIVTTITTTICVLLVILYYIYSLVLALYIDRSQRAIYCTTCMANIVVCMLCWLNCQDFGQNNSKTYFKLVPTIVFA